MENVLGVLGIFALATGAYWVITAITSNFEPLFYLAASAFGSAVALFAFMSIISLLKQIRDRMPPE